MKNDPLHQKTAVEFTGHQLSILRLWAEQDSIAAIARALELSEHTVQTHLKRMRRKLKVNRTFEVYKYAMDKKLIR